MAFSLTEDVTDTEFNFLSLGAGVQSSCIALMADRGEITPKPDAAIFSDTQGEPAEVYRWLDWLEGELSYPVYRVTKGNLMEKSIEVREYKDDPTRHWVKSIIPAFIMNPDGSKGILGRACTADYKIAQIVKKVRKLAGIKRGQKEITVTQWIGISRDEIQRMKKPGDKLPWCQHRWPLVEMNMNRQDCIAWMKNNGYPEPPRSACYFCPFHSDKEWRRLQQSHPEEFAKAIQFEKDLQDAKSRTDNMGGIPFLHPSLKPLHTVDFRSDTDKGQTLLWNDFGNECEGLCGV